MELKTLKDLFKIYIPMENEPEQETVRISDLKQEAIKHIKSQNPFIVFDLDHWKRFFNITEENLK